MEEQTKIYANPFYGRTCIDSGQKIRSCWGILLCIVFFIPAVLGIPFIIKMIGSGEGWYLLTFLGAFSFSLYINANVMVRIAYESDVLLKHYCNLSVRTDFDKDSGSIVSHHIHSLTKIYKRSGSKPVKQDSLIEILHAKLKNKESMVILFSNLMITLGLVGTISGLITTVGGIGSSGGMSEALGGMGTAFYTTLLGSMLGGITLRALHYYVDKKIDSFVLNLAEIIEIRVMPQFRLREKSKELRDIAIATLSALKEMDFIKEEDDEIQSFRIGA